MSDWLTSEQPSLFDFARRGMEEGIQRVEDHADPFWKERAYEAIVRTARRLPDFISDDVWTVGGLTGTREDRALGPVFLRIKRDGIAVKTDQVRPSVRSHLSGKPVWHSLIYQEE